MKRDEQIRNAARYKYPDERIHFIDGAKWADSHPQWIPVEEELPKEKGAYLFHFDDGQTRVEGYFPELHLSKCVTHWMPLPMPPQGKEE